MANLGNTNRSTKPAIISLPDPMSTHNLLKTEQSQIRLALTRFLYSRTRRVIYICLIVLILCEITYSVYKFPDFPNEWWFLM